MPSFFDSKFRGLQATILKNLSGLNSALGYQAVSDSNEVSSRPFSAVNRHNLGSPMIIGFIPPDTGIQGVSYASTATFPTTDPHFSGRRYNDPRSGYLLAAVENVRNFTDEFYDRLIKGASDLGVAPEEYLALILAKSGGDPTASPSSGVAKGLTQYTQRDMTDAGIGDLWMSNPGIASSIDRSTLVLMSQIERSGSVVTNAESLFIASLNVKTTPAVSNPVLYEDPKPSARVYDPSYTSVRPDGMRPLGSNDPGYDSRVTDAQIGFDLNSGVNFNGGNQITVENISAHLNRIRSSQAYQLAVSNLSRRQLGESVSPDLVEPSLEVGIIIDGRNSTVGEFTPAGGNLTEQQKISLKNNYDVRKIMAEQIQKISQTPPLGLLINPSSFKRRYEHTVDYAKGRRRPIVSMWTEKPTTLDVSGQSAGQYVINLDRNGAATGGVTSGQRIFSLSYENLMSLVYIYKNNGYVYFDGAPSTTLNNIPFVPCSIYIYYDGRVYVGSFDMFSISDASDKPFNLSFSFSFTVRNEFQVYNQ